MNGFSDFIPGRWSSHPQALKWQRRMFVFFALLPLFAVIALSVWAFVDCGGWEKFLHPTTASFASELRWLKLVMGLACATGVAYITIMLLHGLAMVGDNGDGDELPFPTWVLVLTLFSWAIPIVFWFIRQYFLPPGRFVVLNILLNGVCLLPVVAIVFWIKIHGERKKKEERRPCRVWPWVVLALVCTLAAMYALTPQCPYRLVWGCVWGGLALMLLVRVVAELAKKKAKKAKTELANDPAKPPEWVDRLKGKLPSGIVLEGGIRRESVPDAARFDNNADPELLLLMDGKTPTIDQSLFFRRFRDSHDAAWKKTYDDNRSILGTIACDLLLTGVEGSGRTEILLASALYAALVRGECVLFLVASQEQAQALKDKVDQRIARMLIGDYVNTAVLTHSVMSALRSNENKRSFPSVLFATPEQVEENFFGDSAAVDSASVEAVRSMLLAYETVLVDDFCDHPLNVRVHLSFLLDKLRLVLANGFVVPQFVVTLSPICRPEGVQELACRLFGVKGFSVDEDIVVLRPRETEPYWFGTIRIGAEVAADKAVADVIRLCLEERLKVVYYSRGMSKSEKDVIAKDLEADDSALRMLSHLDEMKDTDDMADAVLHLSLTSGNAAAAMRLRVGETQAVFLRIVAESEIETDFEAEQLVPLPDETAQSLRVHHLKSVLKFIPPKTPVDVLIWSRFGITITADTFREGRRGDDEAVPAQWFYDSWTEKDYARIAPYLVLENITGITTNGHHIDSGILPAPEEILWRVDLGDGAMKLLLAKPEDDTTSAGSLVEWRDGFGNPLGETDLAHVERLECKTDSNTFVLEELRDVERENHRHALVAVGTFSRGSGIDFVFPERQITWQPAGENPYRCEDPSRVGNIASFRMENGFHSGIGISCSFSGVVNSFGRLDDRPRRPYDYTAYVSGLVLAPNFSPSNQDETAKRLLPLASARVCTDFETYSPTLTHAFTAALKRMFDGAAFYALTLAFWCEGGRDSAGKAVVWFVEPVNSGRSLFPLFKKMQNNPVFLKKFFTLVREYVEKANTLDKMRAASRLAIRGDALSESDQSRARKVLDILVAENEQVEKAETTRRRGGVPPVRKVPDSYTIEEREFDRVVVDAMLNFEPEIDVTKFAAEYGWDHDRISDLFFDVLWNNPQIFYVTKQAQCQWSHCGDIITRFVITDIRYGIAKDEYQKRKDELDGEVREILSHVDASMSDLDKARIIHDWIVRICEYDKVAADRNDGSPLARTAYSVLVRHLAVCEGYTMAYRYLLNKVGIRSEEVISDTMNHCWNYVNLNDSWYHVDVTWDDPIYAGKNPDDDPISHDYFLLSDSAIKLKKHCEWDVRGLPPATDTQYDERKWS